jgi:transcriptional regulator with XRE-family HTH domain
VKYPKAPAPFSVPMDHRRLKWCLEVIGWSRNELARRLDVSESTAAQMVQGKRNIPNRPAVWLETLASIHLALPKPYLWGVSAGEVTPGALRHGSVEEQVAMLEEAFDPDVIEVLSKTTAAARRQV